MTNSKPTYTIQAWHEDPWWIAKVTETTNGADPAPKGSVTQALTLDGVEPMARDLIATILDTKPDAFDIILIANLFPGEDNK